MTSLSLLLIALCCGPLRRGAVLVTPRPEGNQTAKGYTVNKDQNKLPPTDPVAFSALIAVGNLAMVLNEAMIYLNDGNKLAALGTLTAFDDLAQDIYAAIRFLRMDRRPSSDSTVSTGGSWHKNGVTLPDGTEFRFSYKHKLFYGRIINGQWAINDLTFPSPNRMLKHYFHRTGSGQPIVMNSWRTIGVKHPRTQIWVSLDSLRTQRSSRPSTTKKRFTQS